MTVVFGVWIAIVYVATPISLVYGWLRFREVTKARSIPSRLALTSFLFATASAVLAIGSLVYGRMRGGWAFYDPLLMRIYLWGMLISLGGLLLALSSLWKPSLLRWVAPMASLGMLLFWLAAAASE